MKEESRGESRIFMGGGGGGRKRIMCAHAHHEREAQSPLYTRRAGVQRVRLWALEALGVF